MELRRHERFADRSLVAFTSECYSGEGRLDNLSLGGAAIFSEAVVPRGEYLRLRLTFPGQAGMIDIELAPVRWVKDGSFGVEFIRIAPESQERLKHYLDNIEQTAKDAA